jgi:hypothetical protein
MTVADCLREYEILGRLVFGSPRIVTQLRFGVVSFGAVKRSKFSANKLEKIFKEVTHRRSEKRALISGPVTFHVKHWEGLCRT